MAFAEHIALITPGFADGEEDTACIPILQLFVKALHEQGVELTVFALHYPFRRDEFLWHGVRVVPLNGANKRWKRYLLLKRELRLAFSKVHNQQPFTRIHAFWLNEAAVWSVGLGKRFNLPATATIMGQDVLASNRWLKKAEIRKLSKIVSLSSFHYQELLRQTGLTSDIIPLGLPLKKTIAAEKSIDLIGVGNLIPLKDYAYFLQICTYLKKEEPEFKAVIVGTGPEKENLLHQIREFKLEKNVQLVGQKSHEETQELISSAKVLFHPSHFEGFGMVIIEALAAGAIVFARNTGIAATEETVLKISGVIHLDADEVLSAMRSTSFPVRKTFAIQDTLEAYQSRVFNIHTGK